MKEVLNVCYYGEVLVELVANNLGESATAICRAFLLSALWLFSEFKRRSVFGLFGLFSRAVFSVFQKQIIHLIDHID